MTVISKLMSEATVRWIWQNSNERLSGRARHCSTSAWQHLIHADKIAEIAPTVSFFCVTHAVEEAVASFVWSAKYNGYKESAKDINLKNHDHKWAVVELVDMITDHLGNAKISFALHSEKDDLLARFESDEVTNYYDLSLKLLSYNPDLGDTSSDRIFNSFRSSYLDERKMVKAMRARATLRNKTLYAGKQGLPTLSPEELEVQLREHSITAIALIWAALDMTRHGDQLSELVIQSLNAVKRTLDILDATKKKIPCPFPEATGPTR